MRKIKCCPSYLLFALIGLTFTSFVSSGDPLLPASDLYTKESWESTRVNPFMGNTPNLPLIYEVNCLPYCSPSGEGVTLSSKYGWRSQFGRMHRGVDIALPMKTPVYSSWSGVVRVSAHEVNGYGHYIVIRHDNGFETVYAHLSQKLVSRGTFVEAGTLIGKSGNSGRSTGPHLHYEIRFLGSDLNPEKVINFAMGVPLNNIFTWNKTMYHTKSNQFKQKIRIYRLPQATTLDSLAINKDWDIETLCLLNGLLPDMPLKKGRAVRIQ